MPMDVKKEKLRRAVRDFCRATGVRLSVLDADFCPIVPVASREGDFCPMIQQMGRASLCDRADRQLLLKCAASKKPEKHICHVGLVDMAAPLLYRNEIYGYIILGQMRCGLPFEEVERRLSLKAPDSLRQIYQAMPCYDEETVESIANLAGMLASYIMTEDLLTAERDLSEKIADFIDAHLSEPLSVARICRGVGISKNTLYARIRAYAGMSVSHYLLFRRLAVARALLLETDLSVRRVGEQVGIPDPAYFGKVFRQAEGLSPLKFRQTARKK